MMSLRRKSRAIAILLLLALSVVSGCARDNRDSSKGEAAHQGFTDAAGRNLTIPKDIKKVYCTSPIGTIFIYTLAPDRLAGWNYELAPEEKEYILPEYRGLPVLGGWFGKSNTGNIEEILKVRPDIILSMGTVGKSSISSADEIQKKLGIPVLVVDGSLTSLSKTYETMGRLLGTEKKAKELGSYCSEALSWVTKAVASIPEKERPRVYYAEGPKGLLTDPKGSPHVEALDVCGGINVAECPLKEGYGRTEVSIEQIMSWDPDIIIAGESDFFAKVFDDPRWKGLKAVKERRVYLIPRYPFNWFDRPPSVNRVVGLWWVSDFLHKDRLKIEVGRKAKEFYSKFYHMDLTEDRLNKMLNP